MDSEQCPTCAGPSFEKLSSDSAGPGTLNHIFRSRGRSPDLGNAILHYLDRDGSIRTMFHLKASLLDPNRDIYAHDAHWGGGPLAIYSIILYILALCIIYCLVRSLKYVMLPRNTWVDAFPLQIVLVMFLFMIFLYMSNH